MKKLLLLAVAALLAVTSFAQDKGMKFTPGTLTELRAEAAKSDKLIFVDIYATWCGPCKFLSANIFPQESVGRYMNSNFINAKFDGEQGEGIEIAKSFGVKAYPTMLILDKDGREVTRIVGSERTPEDFIKRVQNAMTLAQNKQK